MSDNPELKKTEDQLRLAAFDLLEALFTGDHNAMIDRAELVALLATHAVQVKQREQR